METRHSLVLVALAAVAFGCSSFPAEKTEHTPGKVLVLPPRNAVQDGAQHQASANSGKVLQDSVLAHFRGTSYQPLTTDSASFNNVDIATKDAALAETRRVGGDYCLQLVLGEFRDAAPMTFRSDYVTLSQGVMWSAANGAEVWKMKEPVTYSKGNIGGYAGMVEDFGAEVVKSITR